MNLQALKDWVKTFECNEELAKEYFGGQRLCRGGANDLYNLMMAASKAGNAPQGFDPKKLQGWSGWCHTYLMYTGLNPHVVIDPTFSQVKSGSKIFVGTETELEQELEGATSNHIGISDYFSRPDCPVEPRPDKSVMYPKAGKRRKTRRRRSLHRKSYKNRR